MRCSIHVFSILTSQRAQQTIVYTKESKQAAKVIVWVDDKITAANTKQASEQVKMMLSTRFKMKDEGRFKHFLDVDFSQCDDCVKVPQTKYVEKNSSTF